MQQGQHRQRQDFNLINLHLSLASGQYHTQQ